MIDEKDLIDHPKQIQELQESVKCLEKQNDTLHSLLSAYFGKQFDASNEKKEAALVKEEALYDANYWKRLFDIAMEKNAKMESKMAEMKTRLLLSRNSLPIEEFIND